MGNCIPTKPPTNSPPRSGLERLKAESGYVSGRGGSRSSKHSSSSRQFDYSSRRSEGSASKKSVGVSSRDSGGRLISREDENEGDGAGGNVPQRILTRKKLDAGTEELIDGWPKWLTDNISREALVGIIPKSAESYEKLDKIGQGTYSNVYKARDRETGQIVALKKVRFDTSEAESVRFMAREITILQKLDHPNIVKLLGLATSRMQYSLYLVFDFMVSDLSRIITRKDERLTEPQVKCYMQQLLAGLQHCHGRGILHRDIKGSNLLIDRSGMLKIADFGLANSFDPDKKRPLTSRVVTLWYRAPELLLGSTDYGVGIDLWSAGCLLAEMFTGRPIMPGRTEVEQLHRIFKLCGSPSEDYWKKLKLPASFRPPQPYKPSFFDTFSEFPTSSLGLLHSLLALDPMYRGSASSALQSEFFFASPLPCDLSGLPVIYVKEDEPVQTTERERKRSSKGKQHSRLIKDDAITSEQPYGTFKEDQEKIAADVVSHSQETTTGSSTAGTTSVNPRKDDEVSPPTVFDIKPFQRKLLARTEAHPNAMKNIKNKPPVPISTKTSNMSSLINEGKDSKYRLTHEKRSISTRDFRQFHQEQMNKITP
ncbi:probable serine/threonine-protein kinase At1g54610 [Papaver somniferum]|uniref:probable serine/threonine-protein kinase At1g54610 n=1 Tax=Papaver somniferum TaxID=3469 RepID=UPI000E6FC699|nr:probable serine/threonine-protein kinase At1g54610 [Papaver somniferum]